ncbi:fibronectin type III domain-containing protein [Flavobacterium sp.]|uniref:DUF7619 domain-containing protein n=1 Tax=Flavobacterium sp. TaxID=239 RepID=UPI0037535BD5
MKKQLLLSLCAIIFSSIFSSYSQVGFTCSNPIAIASLPYQTSDNTSNYGDTYDVTQPTTCVSGLNYMTGNDVFYSYTPTVNENLNIRLTPLAGWSGIFVYDGCSNINVACVAGVANSGSTLREIPQLSVLAGHTYIIAISTNATPQTVGYSLQIQNTPNCLNPSQITSSSLTSNSINLSWNNPSSSTSWEVAVVSSGSAIPTNGTATSTNVNFPVQNLISGTSFQAYVRTVCSDGSYSLWSAPFSFTTPASCSAPTSIVASNITSTSANFSWTNNTNVSGYQYAVQLASLTTIPTSGTTVSTNAAIITGLNSNTNYKMYVRSICTNQTFSGWSIPITFTTTVSCGIPTQIVSSNISNTAATFSWLNSTSVDHWEYAVQLTSVTTQPTTGISTTNNTVSISDLILGNSYRFYIRAYCTNQTYSAWTNIVFATLSPPLETPVCGGTFIDNGGLNAFYYNSSDSTVTINPTNAGEVVTVTFTSYDTENNFDGLYVYNGSSINSPIISSGTVGGSVPGAFTGTTIPGPFTSTSTDGSLTFRFKSDSSINKAGWNANVTCGLPPTCPKPILNSVTNLTYVGGTVSWTETGNASQWEIIVLPSTAPVPNTTAVGTLTTSNPFVITGLTGIIHKVYIRSVCSANDISLWSSPLILSPTVCTAPVISNTAGTTNFNWNANSSTQWEVIVLPSSEPFPTASSSGIMLSTNSYQATGLTCGIGYKIYVRSYCNSTFFSSWSSLSFTTSVCNLTNGQAVNMTNCSDSGTNCFDLSSNTPNILGTTNSSDLTITYYGSSSDATNQINALPNSYCITNTTQTIFARINKISTQHSQIVNFTLTSQSVLGAISLTAIGQCDDNNDGFVIFDLTNNPQIITSNTLSYYASYTNAIIASSPITNPTVYSVSINNASTIIFIRESIENGCDKIYSLQLAANSNCNLAYNCNLANSLCSALGVPFTNTRQGISAETGNGNNYGCLGSTPNPTWFYLPVSTAGTLNLTIEQSTTINFTTNNLDVDYIVYGPFTNPVTPCTTGLNQSNTVSCSYSAAPVEYPIIPNAQVGEYYLLMVTNFSNQPGFIRINMNTTSTGAIDCSGLRLNAFLDTNSNGSQDNDEINFPLGQFHHAVNDGELHNVIAPTGIYNIYDISGTNSYDFNYTINPEYSSMYSISNASYSNVNVIIGGGMITYNFPISIIQNYNDLAVVLVPFNAPRAGTSYKNKLVYANVGNQTIPSGTVTFNNNNETTISSISQVGTSSITNGFTYDFSNLLPFESREITITMQVPPIPTVAIGQLLTNTASIVPLTDDVVVSNNSSSLTQGVIAAYDPNDKMESHGEKILFSSFNQNDFLYYTIRFENTGNASAINVSVTDVLDSKIDETTLQMISSSHNYTMDRVATGLTWRFNNIQLPVSVADTNIGKGYITFKVKLKSGFTVGDVIPNTASIYFDSNPAIVTNTFNTEFVSALANANFNTSSFNLFPNPATNSVQIKLSNDNSSLKNIVIYDMIGKTIQSISNINSNETIVDISNFSKGMYLVEITNDNLLKEVKKLIVE